MLRKRLASSLSVVTALSLMVPAALATPVAKDKGEYGTYGRVFLEPVASTNYIQFGEGGHGEFEWGFKLLQELYPRYVEITPAMDFPCTSSSPPTRRSPTRTRNTSSSPLDTRASLVGARARRGSSRTS
jgi:hypothetical protein